MIIDQEYQDFFETMLKQYFFLEHIISTNKGSIDEMQKKLQKRDYLSAYSSGITPYATPEAFEEQYQTILGDGCSANYQPPTQMDKYFVEMMDLCFETQIFKRHMHFLDDTYGIEQKLTSLSEKDREMIYLFYRDHYTLKDIAFVCKSSKQYVSAKLKSIVRRMLEQEET